MADLRKILQSIKVGSDRIREICEFGLLLDLEYYIGQLNQVLMSILMNAIDALEQSNQEKAIKNDRSKILSLILTELESIRDRDLLIKFDAS